MIAKIIRIDRTKTGTDNEHFIRVYFQSLPEKKWLKTDLCERFRNFEKWKFCLVVGNVLDHLRLKNDNTVDADSRPTFVRHEAPPPPEPTQMPLL